MKDVFSVGGLLEAENHGVGLHLLPRPEREPGWRERAGSEEQGLPGPLPNLQATLAGRRRRRSLRPREGHVLSGGSPSARSHCWGALCLPGRFALVTTQSEYNQSPSFIDDRTEVLQG